MINLIPDYLRANNRFALLNVRMLRYTAILAFTMAAIGEITGISILGMQHAQSKLQKQINGQNQKLASYKPLAAQGKQLSDELSTINSLLARQVSFSTLLPQIAKIMPPGSVLQELDVSTSDLLPPTAMGNKTAAGLSSTSSTQKPFVIQASVTNRDVATTLLANIKATSSLFTDADIVSINQSKTGTADANSTPAISTRYPYQVTINAYLKRISPNQNGGTK